MSVRAAPPQSERVSITEESFMSKLSILAEFWEFFKVRKKWWLLPIVLILVIFGTLMIITEGSALAPFLYTLW